MPSPSNVPANVPPNVPPRVVWTYHGSALVRDYHGAVRQLGRLIGLRPIEVSDSSDPMIARLGGMTWIADNSVELVEPTLPEGGPARMMASIGPGMFCLALQVDNLAETKAWLESRNARVVGRLEQEFLFTHPKDTAGIYLEWAAQAFTEWDPRAGAALPSLASPPLINVLRIDHWGALAENPQATLARLQELWPAPVLWNDMTAPIDRPYAGLWVGDGVFALYRIPDSEDEMQRLWGIRQRRARVHLMSLLVDDLRAAEAVFRSENIRILRGSASDGLIVTHPDDVQGLIIAWSDRAVQGQASLRDQ